MRTKILLFIFLLTNFLMAQQGEWEWVKGVNGINQLGVYGTQGVPALANNPGGRENAQYWKDLSGNFWIFGGYGYGASGGVGRLSDLWRFNSSTNEWTWIKGPNSIDQYGTYGTQGVAAPANNPGARADAVTWVDASGNLWMFGGFGWPSSGAIGHLNDLWKYNISTNEWTWMKGTNLIDQNGIYGTMGVGAAINNPGGRWGGAGWTDNNGNLWTFGATGFALSGSGFLNDVWKYDVSLNQWTWMKGSNSFNQNGTYGTQGTPGPLNTPGGRHVGNAWKDFSGNFWTYAGFGYPASGGTGLLDDVWRFNPSTLEWTWMKGSNLINQNGNYGTIGVSSATNNPGGRRRPISWIDPSGLVWMLGGFGYPASGGTGMLHDFWTFDMTTNNWTWAKGSQIINQNGTYGTLFVPAPANISGGRAYATGWADYCGNLWLFSGQGFPGSGGTGFLNDMWKVNNIVAPPTPTNVTPVSNLTVCSGQSATIMAQPIITGSVNWYATPTSTTILGTGTVFTTPNLTTGTYTYYAEAYTCTNSINRAPVSITVFANPTITVNSGSICTGQSFTMIPSGAVSYTYSSGSAVVSPTNTSLFTVVGTNSNGCVSPIAAVSTVTVYNLPTVTVNSGSICSGYNFTMVPGGAVNYTFSSGNAVVTPTSTSTYSVIGENSVGCVSSSSAISTVSVLTSPVMSVTSGSICYGQSFTMVPSGAPSYTFSNGFAVVNPTITTTYSVTGTGTNGCVSPVPGISTITVIPPPVISVSDGSICVGKSFTIMPSGAQTYTFSGGSAVVSPTANTSYSVSGTSSLGCVNYTPVALTVSVLPLPNVVALINPTFICVGENATLSVSGAMNYSWTNIGTNSVEVVSPTLTTNYTVTGTDNVGCENTAVVSLSVDLCTGLSKLVIANIELNIFPNPVNDLLNVNSITPGLLQLFDNTGKMIKQVTLMEGENHIDFRELKSGLYFYKFTGSNNIKTGKIIRN
ncbi:MAG: T9SS type A sorting domain-containing protein [Sphingobacteriaceae bacterium]|nr:T9SS type A sorting domain-containing protein [Sphingobacteriaceae bacterium]